MTCERQEEQQRVGSGFQTRLLATVVVVVVWWSNAVSYRQR